MVLGVSDQKDAQQQDRIFRYKPLRGDIRLVTLKHGKRKHAVQCTMVDVVFRTEPTYVALSYEWGRIGSGSMIWIDGALCRVGANLLNALVHLRKPDKDLVLWVDALCINQNNLGERNHQVELMGRIYTQATEVVIWLGLAGKDSDLAMAQFKAMSQNDGSIPGNAEPILSWCRRTYWRRMWVIQEIQLAKELHISCGNVCIKWSTFADARHYILNWIESDLTYETPREIHEAMKSSLPARMDELRTKGRARHTRLIDWLENSEKSFCTDPKDKVYALVGLASDCQNGELSIDYSKSLSQIWLDVMRLYMSREITEPGSSTIDTANLLYLSNCLFRRLNMNTSGVIGEMRSPKEKIWIRGIYCGAIETLGRPYQVPSTKSSQVQLGLRDKPVSISSTRLCSVTPVSSGATASRGIFGIIYESLFRGTQIPAIFEEQLLPLSSDQWPIPDDLFERTFGLRTAITAQGETILVPPSTQHDDMICILPGCDIALIFRKFTQWTLEGLGVYSTVGRQPMQGEAVHVCLDIPTLEKVTAAAEFDSRLDRIAPWRHRDNDDF